MNRLNVVIDALNSLGEKINLLHQEQDRLLHNHGHKISEYFVFQKQLWEQFYPLVGDMSVKTLPRKDVCSDEMKTKYSRLWELQMASAPHRIASSNNKKALKSYESERSKLLLERRDLEKDPQKFLNF